MGAPAPHNTLPLESALPHPPTVELKASTEALSTAAPGDGSTSAASQKCANGSVSGTLQSPLPAAAPGIQFADYEVLGELGRGGMGVVYKARNVRLHDKIVAIKTLSRSSSASIDEIIRFRAEAELVASLQHENIIDIYDIRVEAGMTYLILEYVDGGSLAEWLKKHRPTPRQAAQMVETLARAMQVAHEKHIVHRDLKPANVLMTKSGVLKITDFGLGKSLDTEEETPRTHAGVIMGTPPYMAPEQAAGKSKDVSPATDVYALGAILYEMLTGRPLFIGDNLTSLLQQMQYHEPVPPSYLVHLRNREKQLSTICLKCLEKNPLKRFHSATELADELRRWLDGEEILTRPPSRLTKAWKYVRRHPMPFTSAAGALVLTVISIGYWINDRERQRSRENADVQSRLRTEAEDRAQQTREQYARSLATLTLILDEVTKGELSRQSGLSGLQQILRKHYRQLQDEEALRFVDTVGLSDDLMRLGKLIYHAGKKENAVEVFEQAKSLYQRGPEAGSPQLICKQAEACTETARVLNKLPHRSDEAREHLRQAKSMLESLTAHDADSKNVKRVRGGVDHLSGEIDLNWRRVKSDVEQAEASLEKALAIREALTDTVEDRNNLARTYGFLGDARLYLGKFESADKAYWESHRLREALFAEAKAENKGVDEAQFELARSWYNFSDYQYHRRSFGAAIFFLERSLKLRAELVLENRANVEYLSDLCACYNRMAELRLLTGAPAAALQSAEEAMKLRADLNRVDPTSLNTKSVCAESLILAAQACLDTDVEKAKHFLDRANESINSLVDIKSGDQMVIGKSRPDDLFNYAAFRAMRTDIVYSKAPMTSKEDIAKSRLKSAKILLAASHNSSHGGMGYEELREKFPAFRSLPKDMRESELAPKSEASSDSPKH